MESTLPIPFLTQVDADSSKGLTPSQAAILGTPLYTSPQQLDNTNNPDHDNIDLTTAYYHATSSQTPDDLLALLNRGLLAIFASRDQAKAVVAASPSTQSRIIPSVAATSLSPWTPPSGTTGLLITDVDVAATDVVNLVAAAVQSQPRDRVFIRPTAGSDLVQVLEVSQRVGVTPVLPSAELSSAAVAALLAATWKTDRADGLVPTVVSDENQVTLGLVYSSEASVAEALRTGTGVYQSRKRGLWVKGATSGMTQQLLRIRLDCDRDALYVTVRHQNGGRFCHLEQYSCFGPATGLSRLEQTLMARKQSAPEGSYTARLFGDEKLLRAKIMEEAQELCDATTKQEIAFEAADVLYFAMTKAIAAGVTLRDIERSLDQKSLKIQRRPGNAKGPWAEKEGITTPTVPILKSAPVPSASTSTSTSTSTSAATDPAPSSTVSTSTKEDRIVMKRIDAAQVSETEVNQALQRPSQKSYDAIMNIITPIIQDVRTRGDDAVLSYTHKFERATSLTSPILRAPFPAELMQISEETRQAIDLSFANIEKFHGAQREDKPLQVETMPGVVCTRFSRAIESVGLYIPGGTAVLPSTALMLGVPAMVAGCQRIVLASPPRADGRITPEIVYVAHKIGAESIVLAGGAQAVAALAYGTQSLTKVDKILGPGNQFVTAAKMFVSNDTNAGVSIDMPAGPSEVLVMADAKANPAFVVSDLLSQAEHGVDSQVVLVAVDLSSEQLQAIDDELHRQAVALPRSDIVRGSIAHSLVVQVPDLETAMRVSNAYAPEHLILQIEDAQEAVEKVVNAGSVFIGAWTPESVGDYSAGVNHSLPTYGYAKQYSGVNLASFVKHITSSCLTADGLQNVGPAVMQLASVEELEAHRRAVSIRLEHIAKTQ